MNSKEKARLEKLYKRHVQALKLQGKRPKTIDAYSRAVRRLAGYFDRCPDRLTEEDLKTYFADLVKSHSWSTVKVDRIGLQFFWDHTLGAVRSCSATGTVEAAPGRSGVCLAKSFFVLFCSTFCRRAFVGRGTLGSCTAMPAKRFG